MKKAFVISSFLVVVILLGYGKIVFDRQSEFHQRVTDPSEYGSVSFLEESTEGSKYFNLYPLESGEILPCPYSTFKVEKRILNHVQLRKDGKVPPYVSERNQRNIVRDQQEKTSTSGNADKKNYGMTALGSGFVLEKSWVITNHHLIERSDATPILEDLENDLAALSPIFKVRGKSLDAVRIFGSYDLSELTSEEVLGRKAVIEGFQMQEILRIEGPLEMIDDQDMGILLNSIKGSVYWGVASGLSGSPVLDAATGKVLGVARSAGYYTNEDFPEDDERNTYIRIIDIDTLRSFIKEAEKNLSSPD